MLKKLLHLEKSKEDNENVINFDPSIKYEITLRKMSEDFNKKWENINPSPETGLSNYDNLAVIGVGSFGVVCLVKNKASNAYHAVKCLAKEQVVKRRLVTSVMNERSVLECIDFPFLINLEFSSKDNSYLYLGLPLLNGGELFTVHRRATFFNENQARFYAAQVFLGLEYLHNVSILHRDIKPENLIIDLRGYIKIIDFGFAKKVLTRTLTLCGTPEYMAPEVILSRPYGTCADWWAFGILLYELVNGRPPFRMSSKNHMSMFKRICEGNYAMPSSFSSSLCNLIGNLLQVDMSKRYGHLLNGNKDIKHHEWFRKINWFNILNQKISAPFVPKVENIEDLSNFMQPNVEVSFKVSDENKYSLVFTNF